MNKTLITYISKELISGSQEITITPNEDLLGGGLIDSLGMMRLLTFIESEFNIEIPPEDMVIENFMTVDCIVAYLRKRNA